MTDWHLVEEEAMSEQWSKWKARALAAEDELHELLGGRLAETLRNEMKENEQLREEKRVAREDLEAEIERLQDNIRELQRRYERRETLHTSDFTAAIVAALSHPTDKEGSDD